MPPTSDEKTQIRFQYFWALVIVQNCLLFKCMSTMLKLEFISSHILIKVLRYTTASGVPVFTVNHWSRFNTVKSGKTANTRDVVGHRHGLRHRSQVILDTYASYLLELFICKNMLLRQKKKNSKTVKDNKKSKHFWIIFFIFFLM